MVLNRTKHYVYNSTLEGYAGRLIPEVRWGVPFWFYRDWTMLGDGAIKPSHFSLPNLIVDGIVWVTSLVAVGIIWEKIVLARKVK